MSETAPTTDERAMPITALAPWFGAKRILAAQIVAEFGEHRTYWEPFAGSMAVLMAKPPVSMETVNDLHRDLINLACVVRDQKMGPRLYRMLRRTLMHEDLFDESDAFMREVERTGIAGLPEGLPRKMVERAYNFFVVSWMGRNGCAGQPSNKKGTYCARFTNKGGHAATRWHKAVSSIAAWRRRLAHVTILRQIGRAHV